MSRRSFSVKLKGAGPKGAWIFLGVPFSVEKVWGTRARLAVRGTLNGFAFRSSIFPMGGGRHTLVVNKQMQAGAGAGKGDRVRVAMEPDTAARTVRVPAALKRALARAPKARAFFAALSYTHRKEYCRWIAEAKQEETRARRAAKAVEMLARGVRGR